jgi:hypothetical protein
VLARTEPGDAVGEVVETLAGHRTDEFSTVVASKLL